MRFEIVDVRPCEARPSKRSLHDTLLRRTVRDNQSRARPILVDGGTLDNTPDTVAISLRLAQPLQNDYSTALATHIAVRRRIEGVALSPRRQHPDLHHEPGNRGGKHRLHASGESQVYLVPL